MTNAQGMPVEEGVPANGGEESDSWLLASFVPALMLHAMQSSGAEAIKPSASHSYVGPALFAVRPAQACPRAACARARSDPPPASRTSRASRSSTSASRCTAARHVLPADDQDLLGERRRRRQVCGRRAHRRVDRRSSQGVCGPRVRMRDGVVGVAAQGDDGQRRRVLAQGGRGDGLAHDILRGRARRPVRVIRGGAGALRVLRGGGPRHLWRRHRLAGGVVADWLVLEVPPLSALPARTAGVAVMAY